MMTKSTGSMFSWEIPPKVRKQKCCPAQTSHQPKKATNNKDDSKGKKSKSSPWQGRKGRRHKEVIMEPWLLFGF